jgi:hypothetical protein
MSPHPRLFAFNIPVHITNKRVLSIIGMTKIHSNESSFLADGP